MWLLAVLGCDGAKIDTELTCEDGEGLVNGTVTVDGEPSSTASVWAEGENGEYLPLTLESDGTFQVCLAEGAWDLWAAAEGCDGADPVDVTAGGTFAVDVNLNGPCDTKAEKPNLYLYPSAPTRTSVRIGVTDRQRIFASDPPYRDAWRGVAMPDGTFVTDHSSPFLFYEVTLERRQVRQLQHEEGWCFEGSVADGVAGMAGVLDAYGFNAAEIDDFVEGWRVDLPPAGAWAVYPQTSVDPAASLRISPSLPVQRLWLLVEDPGVCDGALPAPAVVPFDRSGPHAVEWGVVLNGIVQ